jgi:uncharacterized linocin/CFP29 family protein
MSSNDPQLAWTDDQWSRVQAAVQEAARNARVASSFLPLVGPLASSDTTIPAMRMEDRRIRQPGRGEGKRRLAVEEHEVLSFATISADVYLKNSEVTEPDLTSATAMFARAADLIACVEDAVVFNGIPKKPLRRFPDAGHVPLDKKKGEPVVEPLIYKVHGGNQNRGLLGSKIPKPVAVSDIVDATVRAVEQLEAEGHYGPFACVLGHKLFRLATKPSKSLVLPSDRMTPFLNGPLLRSSTIPETKGLVIALAGNPVDLVVATDITVKFLQLSVEPRYVFRVYERMALRVKQLGAVCVLEG